jgi:hypothetical protein
LEIFDVKLSWEHVGVFLGGGILGVAAISWWQTGDPLAYFKAILGMPSLAGAATTNADRLQSYIPSDQYIYEAYPEDYPMGPLYTQRSYGNIADPFYAGDDYPTRSYGGGRAYAAHQQVHNEETFELERDHEGRIISYKIRRNVVNE